LKFRANIVMKMKKTVLITFFNIIYNSERSFKNSLEILADKRTWIPKIAKFLGVENFDLDQVIENTSIDKTRQRRKEKVESQGVPFREGVVYRKGTSNSWKTALSEEVLDFYEKTKPN